LRRIDRGKPRASSNGRVEEEGEGGGVIKTSFNVKLRLIFITIYDVAFKKRIK